jgi:hypothetical protein
MIFAEKSSLLSSPNFTNPHGTNSLELASQKSLQFNAAQLSMRTNYDEHSFFLLM